jgi:hypothetical protein
MRYLSSVPHICCLSVFYGWLSLLICLIGGISLAYLDRGRKALGSTALVNSAGYKFNVLFSFTLFSCCFCLSGLI